MSDHVKLREALDSAMQAMGAAYGYLGRIEAAMKPKGVVPTPEEFMDDDGPATVTKTPAVGPSEDIPAKPRTKRPPDSRVRCAACGNPIDDEGRCRKCAKVPPPPELAAALRDDNEEKLPAFMRPATPPGVDHEHEVGGWSIGHGD